MTITLYTMNGCGFCVKAKKMFDNEIRSGEIKVLDAKYAQGKFRGFPTFTYKNRHHSGLPRSKHELYDKLKYNKEHYSHGTRHRNNHNCTVGIL